MMSFHSGDDSDGNASLSLLTNLVADRAAEHPDATAIALFLGAGADISSGGLTFAQLKRAAVEQIVRDRLFLATTERQLEEQFELLFEKHTAARDRGILIDHLLHRMNELDPSDAYKLLVLLAEAGGIDAVITTNFDVMLERAETLLDCNVFEVRTTGMNRPFWPAGMPTRRKAPYLKLHGDLGTRVVTHLTEKELREGRYESTLLDYLRTVAATHDMVFAGYSGNDPVLANVIGEATAGGSHRVFWVNVTPPDAASSLHVALHGRAQFIAATFDKLIATIARPVLQKPRYGASKMAYIRSLFEWRVEHSNATYLNAYSNSPAHVPLTVTPRPEVERAVRTFLASERPLAILAGPSGYGKTTLGIRLADEFQTQASRYVVLLTAKSLDPPNIEAHLSERLGGLGPRQPFSIASLETWLHEQKAQLLIFIDALNEYRSDLDDCATLLRNIIRLCYYLPDKPTSAIRIIATIRQETWNSVIARVDLGALRQVLWTPSQIAGAIEAIPIGLLTDGELRSALERLRSANRTKIRFDDLSPMAVERLRDPFLLAAIASASSISGLSGPTSSLYRVIYHAMLSNNGVGLDAATLEDALARVALIAAESKQEVARRKDLTPESLRGDLHRAALDLGILIEQSDNFLRFRHDRLHEYFLSVALSLPEGPRLGTLSELRDYLQATKHNPKARSAARMHFAYDVGERFRLIEEAMLIRRTGMSDFSETDRELLFGFAREVIYELCESNPPVATRYIRAGIRAAAEGRLDNEHLRTLVQTAASLPNDAAIPALAAAAVAGDDLAATEASIYAVDKLLRRYLTENCPGIDFSTATPYEMFLADASVQPWRQLGRVMRFLSRAGPDNLHPAEYSAVTAAIAPLAREVSSRPWSKKDVTSFTEYYLRNTDRLLFNATPDDFHDFFRNDARHELASILADLRSGETLQLHHLDMMKPYTESMDFVARPMNVEFNICTLLFILSGFNDFDATLALWEQQYDTFTNQTSPVAIDYYQGVLIYLHSLFNVPYDNRFAEYEERVLRDWPSILRFTPGLLRGRIRGFRDEFDMIFEDGFGVISPYGLLLPPRRRKEMTYEDYARLENFSSRTEPLPLYSRYLRLFLTEGRNDEILQMLQALNEVIVAWPIEGLATLRDAIGVSDPNVHTAVVRVLAEAYCRHPTETVRFLRATGSALNDVDLQEIKIRRDPRIGRRQVSQQEWSRIGYYFLRDRSTVRRLLDCLQVFIDSTNFESAVARVLQTLEITSARR